jgi:general secretion pathway protein D
VRNILIYTGPAQEAQGIAEMVSVLDVDVLAGMSFALFPVQSSDARDVVDELETLFAEDAVGTFGGVIRFLPIERLNAILAIASRPAHLKHAGQWVARLDRADAAAGERVFVYYAKNSRANDLADILNQVFQGAPGGRDEVVSRAAVAPGLEPVELIAPRRVAPGAEESAAAETPAAAAPAFAVEAPGAGILRTSGGSAIRIVADERNNAVVVVATAAQFGMIEATLRRLDILPLQVLIEATIAEVALNDALEYGLQWAFSSGDFSGSSTNNFLGAVAPAFPGFNLVLDTSDVRVVLSALSEITDVEVVSSPQLMVLDNQTARLQVGDQVPVSTQSSVSSLDPDAPIVNSIDYFDTGVILEVTPRVNASGLVTLDIALDVSDAIPTETSGIDSPTIQQRSIRTTVSVQSGETVALGGLIRERSTESVTGVPILMDIPILGNLFKTTGQGTQRTELLVLITPRVVRGAAQARAVTDELRRRLTTLRDVVASAE